MCKEIKEKNQFILNGCKKIKYGYDGDDFSFDNERPESRIRFIHLSYLSSLQMRIGFHL